MYNPKLKEECAVFGISNTPEASTLTALGLHALQHRGQDSTGIVSYCKKQSNFFGHRGIGQVSEVFGDSNIIKKLEGMSSIGHNRYGLSLIHI